MPSLLLAPEVRRLALASQGWRGLVAVLALALGVALGYGVHLVHAVALAESEGAARRLAGEADLVVRAVQESLDEGLYPRLAGRPEVAVASPAVELEAKVAGNGGTARRQRLRVLGIDVFQAARLQPALAAFADPRDILAQDRLFLNPAAQAWLQAKKGDTLVLQAGVRPVAFTVAGSLDLSGEPLAVMDIAAAQTAFGLVGRLSRLDLRLAPGLPPEEAASALAGLLPPGARLEAPEARARQAAEFSRAYRVNLNMLALVALFTGSLLVFSCQALAVLRRRPQLALLRTLGLSRREILVLLLAEAAVLGLAGGLLGLGLGQALAVFLLKVSGPDLGGAYFRGLDPRAGIDLAAMAVFLGLGLLAALAGSLVPALAAARARLARALHAGDEEDLFARHYSARPGLFCLALGTLAALPPPVGGLPLFGYGAVALFLLGTIGLLPVATAGLLGLLARLPIASAGAQLGLAQLRGSAGQVSLSLAPLVASVAVAAAMAIMVGSFRHSLEGWLDRLLPADLYLRTGIAGDSAFLPPEEQERIGRLPGVARVEFRRSLALSLEADKPPLTVLARAVDPKAPDRSLPMVGSWRVPAGDTPGLWVSEAAADIHGWQPGDRVELPLDGGRLPLQVAGVWRDYARSGGAVVLERQVYEAASGDRRANEAAIWLEAGAGAPAVARRLAALFPAGGAEVEEPGELKRLSLAIFDRTFAATYALEAAAVLVGLAGLSASFAGLVLARRREFGVLRHLGLGRRDIAALLALQGGLLGLIALAVGFALSAVLSLVLIHVINRQSFHWSMDLLVPWLPLVVFGLLVAGLAAVTAAASGRLAMGREAALAVREDW